MRIAIIQGAFLPVPPLRGGAVEKVWCALGAQFTQAGHLVRHYSRLCDGLPQTERINGVDHIRIPGFDTPSGSLAKKALDLIYTLRAVRRLIPSDIIVTNTFWSPLLINRGHGLTYVHVARYPKRQLFLYRKAARLQTVSTAVLAAMQRQAPTLKSIMSVIPYPVQLPATLPPPSDRRKIVTYAGRIHPEKGISLLINAFADCGAMRGWSLKLVGPWETSLGGGGAIYKQSLIDLASARGVEVSFTGGIFRQSKLFSELVVSSIFVYPSLADFGETFGVAPLEAMACGCAVVLSDLACFRDFAHDRKNCMIFDHRSSNAPKRLADILSLLGTDSLLLLRLSAAARSTALGFTEDAVARLYLADFRKVIERETQACQP